MKLSMNTKQGRPTIRSAYLNENGVALVIALMFMAILGVLGTSAYVMTSTDMQIGANYKASVQAFNAGQAGLDEARGRLKGSNSLPNFAGDPDTSPDPMWSAYILTSGSWSTADDPNYKSGYTDYIPIPGNHTNTTPQVNSLQTDIPYWVKIRHKREYDAELAGHDHSASVFHYNDGDGVTTTNSADSPGKIIYYGDDPATTTTVEWVDFTYNPGDYTATEIVEIEKGARPIEIVRAYGSKNGGLSTLEIGLKGAPRNIDAKAAIYAKDNVTGNGSSLSVDANGPAWCPSSTPLPDTIYTYSIPSAETTTTLNGNPTLIPTGPDNGDRNVDITDMIDSLLRITGEKITSDQNGTTYGSSTDFLNCYSDTSDPYNVQGLKLQNVTGWGLLLVKGDLVLGGGFTWKGLILVSGVLAFNGGGGPNAINIEGAVMANQTVAINGSINVQYNACYVNDALGEVTPKIASWKEDY